MPWALLLVCALTGLAGGGGFGLARGLSHLPTLPVALVEGAILVGVPATFLGLVLVALWSAGSAVRRHHRGGLR